MERGWSEKIKKKERKRIHAYMIVNFRTHKISRGARKLAWTPWILQKIHAFCVDPTKKKKTKATSKPNTFLMLNLSFP
jgi:hypothetical protein